jgi:leader peptidase (prepilin peptidase)/N-methyltransferase
MIGAGVSLPPGRCGGCRQRLGAPPWGLEVVTVAGVLLLVGEAGQGLMQTLAYAWWVAFAVPLLFIDLEVRRLPDRLTLPAAAGTYALLGVAALAGDAGAAWVRAGLAGAGCGLAFAVSTFLLGQRGFGLGDAKLMLSCGAILGWLGWPVLVFGLIVAFIGSGLVSLVLLVARRIRWSGELPFGPFLIVGTVAALLVAS